ncbi:MAG: AAA family ATPase [Microcystaceae cyanobacterium]
MKLLSARMQNFKSLEDVTLNFCDLTMIVGANATGKSNCLEVLKLFQSITKTNLPSALTSVDNLLKDPTKPLKLSFCLEAESKSLEYQFIVSQNSDQSFSLTEKLQIENQTIIEVMNNQGFVMDEDGQNKQSYHSNESILALKTAGYFGNKPLTLKLSDFIKSWQFYDFEPSLLRGRALALERTIDTNGEYFEDILFFYSQVHPEIFNNINQELKWCLDISLVRNTQGQSPKIFVQEGSQKLSLNSVSDGTLRIIGYCTLLYHPNLAPLVGIEEPERNLHPAVLMNVATILTKLSQRTQVILTTHSSQLLDCFTTEDLAEDISILLLSKPDDHGTQVFQLEKLRLEQESLADWMENFGIGSAVYHSNLLEGVLQAQYA